MGRLRLYQNRVQRRLVCFMTMILVLVLFFTSCAQDGIDLRKENINGIRLMTKRNDTLLQKAFGRMTHQVGDEKERTLEFTNKSFMVYVDLNQKDEIVNIAVGSDKENRIKTQKNVGPHSFISDVIKAYGNQYVKKTYQDYLGSGAGYFITYTDKTNRIILEFEVNTGYAPLEGRLKRNPADRVANVALSSF